MSSGVQQPMGSQQPTRAHGSGRAITPTIVPLQEGEAEGEAEAEAEATQNFLDIYFGDADFDLGSPLTHITHGAGLLAGQWLEIRETILNQPQARLNGRSAISAATLSSPIGSRAYNGICQSTLTRLRHAARDYGFYDEFFREVDEAFVEALSESCGTSRIPIPLLVPIDGNCFMASYALLIRDDQRADSCWDSYHARLVSIMQRVARDLGVPSTPDILYISLAHQDRGAFEEIGRHVREWERVPARILQGEWPQTFSSRVHRGTWVGNMGNARSRRSRRYRR